MGENDSNNTGEEAVDGNPWHGRLRPRPVPASANTTTPDDNDAQSVAPSRNKRKTRAPSTGLPLVQPPNRGGIMRPQSMRDRGLNAARRLTAELYFNQVTSGPQVHAPAASSAADTNDGEDEAKVKKQEDDDEVEVKEEEEEGEVKEEEDEGVVKKEGDDQEVKVEN